MKLDFVEIQYLRGLVANDQIINDYKNNPQIGISQIRSMYNLTETIMQKLDSAEEHYLGINTELNRISISFERDEWEYILSACEDLSCGYRRTDPVHDCCDLNDIVPVIRKRLGIPSSEDEGVQ